MKKTLIVLMAFCLLLCCTACNQSQKAAEGTGGTTETSVTMTDSYKQGRQSYYDVSGILLPEIADVTMADSSCFDEDSACLDITGTHALYTDIVDFFTDHFGTAPEMSTVGDLEKSNWEFEKDEGGTDCYEVCWNSEGLIYINYWKN